MKQFDIFVAGGEKIGSLMAKNIRTASKIFMEDCHLDEEMTLNVESKEMARIGYPYRMCSEYLVMEH